MANEIKDLVVVDDNPVLLSILLEIFKECGHMVRTASDGFAGLATIRERVPDILICDLSMPRMSGFELLSIVRRRFPSIAVVAMSGAYSGETVPRGVAADAFYAKGSTSVARLFEILGSIKNESVFGSLRGLAPIWIPGVPDGEHDRATVAVACPECLRPFRLHNAGRVDIECCCPHCLNALQLAIVGQLSEMDQTGLGMPAETGRVGGRYICAE